MIACDDIMFNFIESTALTHQRNLFLQLSEVFRLDESDHLILSNPNISIGA